MTAVRSIGNLDLRCWDALQPPGGFYAASPWLRHAERSAKVPPYYLTTQNWRSAMPAYPLDRADPYVFCRVDHVLAQIADKAPPADGLLPVLACGARNPGYTFVAAQADMDHSATRGIVLEAEALADEGGLEAVSYLYVHHSDSVLCRSPDQRRSGHAHATSIGPAG